MTSELGIGALPFSFREQPCLDRLQLYDRLLIPPYIALCKRLAPAEEKLPRSMMMLPPCVLTMYGALFSAECSFLNCGTHKKTRFVI